MGHRHFPKRNDPVNDTRRPAPHQNGFVQRVLYTDDGPEEVIVQYGNEMVFYDFTEFEFTWRERGSTSAYLLDKENHC